MPGKGSLDLMVVAPVFFSPAHGAATYYGVVCGALAERGVSVTVVSDRERGAFEGGYVGLFPTRCGRNRSGIRDPLAYALQNLCYLALPRLVRQLRPRAILVHASFFNFPGLLPWVVRRLRGLADAGGMRLVADVRDVWTPPRRIGLLRHFDAVISCSDSVTERLRRYGLDAGLIRQIPVPQEPLEVDSESAERLLRQEGLESVRYLFYAGLVKEAKGSDLLLRAFLDHVRSRFPDVRLVIAGLLKTGNAEVTRALEDPAVAFLGPRPRRQVLELASRAAVCVSLSPIESLSRASLEALALGRPTLLPPNIPEFERHCPEFVVRSDDPAEVGAMMRDLLERPRVADYPVERHELARVLPRYLEVLGLDPSTATPI